VREPSPRNSIEKLLVVAELQSSILYPPKLQPEIIAQTTVSGVLPTGGSSGQTSGVRVTADTAGLAVHQPAG